MRRGVWLVAALLSAALACDACTPDAPLQTPTPAPSPTFTCSTSTVNDPCTADKAKKEKEQAAAYSAAESSYRSFLAERNRLINVGGAKSPTAAMSAYAAGPYLKAMVGYLAEQRADNLQAKGSIAIGRLEPAPSISRADAPAGELTLVFCEDAQAVTLTDSDGQKTHGQVRGGQLYVRRVAGTWKIWDATDRQVKSCAEVS